MDVGQRGSLHTGSLQTPEGGIGCDPPGTDPWRDADKLFGKNGFLPPVPAAKARAKCGGNVEALGEVWL